jgi:FlaA1/EpsC-like NDP-sugar epimerase
VDARIVFTGLRPGEKVREELICPLETSVATSIPKIRLVQAPDEDGVVVSDMLARIVRAQGEPEPSALVRELAAVIPEYTPLLATPVETPVPHAMSITLEPSGAS